MLKAEQVAFRYHKKQAWLFKDLDIEIASGEIVGLPGPSGKGKSTLAKVLGGFLNPHEGNVCLDGHPLPQKDFCPVQLLFQHPELAVNPRWTIKQILQEAGMPPGSILHQLAIENTWMNRYPHELSGGELQRVCLARALNSNVKYLLCDEMTSMLDALTQAAIWKAVLGIVEERNLGLLVISHDMALISMLCHRVISCFQN